MAEYVPEKYKIKSGDKTVSGHAADKLIDKETGEWYFLTNRSFEEIDHFFSNLPSRTIKELKKIKPREEVIRILDIGGGIKARSAGDIADTFGSKHDDRVQVFNLDLTATGQNKEGLHQVVGDMMRLPIKDNSIDLAYSHHSISLREEIDSDALVQALEEVARTLRPGGIFFLDKIYTEKWGKTISPLDLEKLSEKFGVVFYSKEIGLFLEPVERILKKINKEHPNWKFIIMIKEPVDEELMKTLKIEETYKPKNH
ncbi:class I SAM-dependent methyltransferase [Patescibacteria group bacterium AH-259-L05]|nr:class I SAM-dependent methyltransferase [Patescibacteria group bacterium AH-259-L05]